MGDQSTPSVQDRHLRLMDAALDLQQAGENSRALEILSLVREETVDFAPVHLLLGLTYQELGQVEEAEASLRQALEVDPDYPEALQALGLLLSSRGRLAEAIGLLRQHLKASPQDPTSLKALSAALLRDGRPEEALQYLQETWRQTQAEEPGVQLGRLLIQLGAVPQAEEILQQVAHKLPSPRTYAEWGLALTLLQRHEDACQALQRAIELDLSFDRAWRGLAHCRDRMGRSAEAIEAADRALAINEGHYRNWQAKGDALLSLGRYGEALSAAQRGIGLIDPEDDEARPVLFELLRQELEALVGLGRFEEALAQLDAWRQRFPEEARFPRIQASLLAFLERYQEILALIDSLDPALAENLAPYRYEALHVMGKPEEAWEMIRPQLEVEAERQAARLHRLAEVGLSLYLRGHPAPTRAIFEQLHRLDPREPRFASNLAFALIGDGEVEEAVALLQQALEAPETGWRAIVLANLGYVYLLQGNLEQAEAAFREVVERLEVEEDHGAILRVAYWRDGQAVPDYLSHPRRFLPIRLYVAANQAALRLAAGDPEGAEALARQVVEEAPDVPLGHVLLGAVRLAAGDPGAARQAWEQALACAEDAQEREALARWLQL